MKTIRHYFRFFFISVLICCFTLTSFAQIPVGWTSYVNSSRPNVLGLDPTTGAKSIAYSPLNNDVYSFGQIYYDLPAVPSGLAWGKEFGIKRYNHLTGVVIDSVLASHHNSWDSIPFLDSPGEMIIASDGSVYITGKYYFNSTYSYDMVVIKYNSSLIEQWRYYFYGPGISVDAGIAITFDPSGNICVAGQIGDYGTGTGNDFLIAKLTTAGTLLWQSVFNWNSVNNDTPTDITTDNKGNVYVSGYTNSAASGNQYAVLKFSDLGVFKWKKSYNGSSGVYDDKAYSIAVDNSSKRVVVTGTATNASGNTDIATQCYDSLGTVKWTKKINNAGNSNDHGYKVVINSGHRVFVGGDVDRDASVVTSGDLIIKKYDLDGNVLKTIKYNGTSYNCAFGDLAVAHSGSIYMTGTCDGAVPAPGHGNSLVTLKYNSGGSLLWSDLLSPAQFQTCGEGYYGWCFALNEAASEIAVGGRHFVDCPGANSEQWLTRRYSPTLRLEAETTSWNKSDENEIGVYPVPASDVLHLKFSKEVSDDFLLSIYSVQGQLQKSIRWDSSGNEISIKELPAGIYFLEMMDGSKTYRIKFLKN